MVVLMEVIIMLQSPTPPCSNFWKWKLILHKVSQKSDSIGNYLNTDMLKVMALTFTTPVYTLNTEHFLTYQNCCMHRWIPLKFQMPMNPAFWDRMYIRHLKMVHGRDKSQWGACCRKAIHDVVVWCGSVKSLLRYLETRMSLFWRHSHGGQLRFTALPLNVMKCWHWQLLPLMLHKHLRENFTQLSKGILC